VKTKTRLTITLSHELLNKVDSQIDGHTVRNRSHAIESLVRQSLSTQIGTAVILAGGKHKKGQLPALKKINNRPLLSLTFEHLKKYGITQIIVCAGVNEQEIKKEFGDGSKFGVNIIYSKETKSMGSAGALKNAQKHLPNETFLVINDNTLTNLNLNDLFEFHDSENAMATICVKPRKSEKKYGQAFLHGNKIVKFLDTSETEGISIVSIGLYVLSPELIVQIPKNKFSNLETDIFPKLAENKELSAFVFQGSWYDVSMEESYKEAVSEWSEEN
jgi:mannose-1-phosphate guanylyltransferase